MFSMFRRSSAEVDLANVRRQIDHCKAVIIPGIERENERYKQKFEKKIAELHDRDVDSSTAGEQLIEYIEDELFVLMNKLNDDFIKRNAYHVEKMNEMLVLINDKTSQAEGGGNTIRRRRLSKKKRAQFLRRTKSKARKQ